MDRDFNATKYRLYKHRILGSLYNNPSDTSVEVTIDGVPKPARIVPNTKHYENAIKFVLATSDLLSQETHTLEREIDFV